MDSGYYSNIVEYDSGFDAMSLTIENWVTQEVRCFSNNTQSRAQYELDPIRQYSEEELAILNTD